MKIVYAAVLVSLLFSGCVQKANDPGGVQAIKKSLEDYEKAVNARDPNAAVSMMTEKTFCAEPNVPAVTGKDAIRGRLQKIFERFSSFDLEFSAPVSDVQVRGDLGAAQGSWMLRAKRSGVVAPINESGSWAVICRRETDGSWKWDSVTVTSDQPLSQMGANSEDEKALVQMEQDMAAAMVNGNKPEEVQRRAKALGSLAKSYALSSLTIKDLNPRVFGDVAVVDMTGDMQGLYNGRDSSGTLRGIDVFVKRDGRWQLTYSQNTVSIP